MALQQRNDPIPVGECSQAKQLPTSMAEDRRWERAHSEGRVRKSRDRMHPQRYIRKYVDNEEKHSIEVCEFPTNTVNMVGIEL
jgi:hypothetical protein